MRIVVKVGTSTLAHATGLLNIRRVEKLCQVMSDLKNAGHELVLVSSGAIGMGVGKLSLPGRPSDIPTKQAAAAVGQCELMYTYDKLFSEHNHTVAQILITGADLRHEDRRENFHNTLYRLLELGVLPIVNENDTISVTELMFTDNDELSGLIATMMDVQALVILSNVDGIYNGKPGNEGVTVIPTVEPNKDLSEYIHIEKSGFGRGGMITKCNIARKVADEGVTVMIANGKRDGILTDLIFHPESVTYTCFQPKQETVSSVKKWIAHSAGFTKGRICLNEKAVDVVCGDKAVSILPVGVTHVEGEFEKDDLVQVVSPEGKVLGVGRIAYDSADARAVIGMHDCKPMVHYDYLYLE